MHPVLSTEQRFHTRYRMKDGLLAAVQGGYFGNPACVVDLNRNGACLCSLSEAGELTGKFIALDLISERNRAILRSLSARVVYTCTPKQRENEPTDTPKRRYGVQFVNLTALEERMLDQITRKYALPE